LKYKKLTEDLDLQSKVYATAFVKCLLFHINLKL